MNPSAGDGMTGEDGCIEQHFSLELAYPVRFTVGMFEVPNLTLLEVLTGAHSQKPVRVLAVVDEGLSLASPDLLGRIGSYFAAHERELSLAAEPLTIAGGEQAKNDPRIVAGLLERLFALRMDRHAYLLAVGGGAVLDAVGYAAALFHRGLRLVRAPTTVLAQDDAGIGVKNGINAFGVKNALGTFAPPHAVVNDFALLATLSQRDHIAGIAEAIKVALIRDGTFFAWIERHAEGLRERDPVVTRRLIRRCAELHLEHIRGGGDPFETGSARPLDFGHWAAHKLEILSGYELRHGEAVAIGMGLDARYAQLAGALEQAELVRVLGTIERVGLPLWHPALEQVDDGGVPVVLQGLEEFREHLGGRLTVTMLAAIGRGTEVHEIDQSLMRAVIGHGKP